MSKNSATLVLPTSYLPPIEYFVAITQHENILIEANETYPKQTYRNRCYIMAANDIQLLSIPVSKPNGNHTQTKDIVMVNDTPWYQIHWRSIESAYNASPYFLYYQDDFKEFYSGQFSNLCEFNLKLLRVLLSLIGLKVSINFTDNFVKQYECAIDLRYSLDAKKESNIMMPPYIQVFSDKHGFKPNLSIVDLLFNEGPATLDYLQSIKSNYHL